MPLLCLVLLGSRCTNWGEPELWAPPQLEDGVAGHFAIAAQFSVGAGAAVAGRLELCAMPPLMLPGSLRLQTQQSSHG